MSTSSAFMSRARCLPVTIAAVLSFMMLAGCVRSATPLLTDAQPLLGQHVRFQHYDLRDGGAYDPEPSEFTWDGARYVGLLGKSKEPAAFTVFAFEGRDFIIQNAPPKKDAPVEYALMRKLADGLYLTFVIDEHDADEATRTKLCADIRAGTCVITTREALFAFARATAAKPRETGGLAIVLGEEK